MKSEDKVLTKSLFIAGTVITAIGAFSIIAFAPAILKVFGLVMAATSWWIFKKGKRITK